VYVLKVERLCNKQPAESENEENTKAVTSSVAVNSTSNDVTPPVPVSSSSQSSSVKISVPQTTPTPPAPRPAPTTRCPFRVIEICNTCWTRSNCKDVIPKSSKAAQCNKVGHPWVGVSFLILPCRKLLGNLPPTIPRNLHFTVCWDLAKYKRCRRAEQNICTFAHCDEEIAVWKWMVQNKGQL